MKRFILIIWIFSILLAGCKKNDTSPQDNKDKSLTDNTIVVSNDVINNSLVSVDSTKLIFTSSGAGVDKIKVGSILASDITTKAPDGFLRKVISISDVGGNKICVTEQASLTDAIINADVTYTKAFSDNDIIGKDTSGIDISASHRGTESLSFTFPYKVLMYDADGNKQTTYDQINIEGDIKLEPSFDYKLQIVGGKVTKLLLQLNLKNTNNIKGESKVVLASLKKEVPLVTFQLAPFTLPGPIPVPIAKQWVAIVIGVDGAITAKITAGAQNINTANAGVVFENDTWSTINDITNTLSIQPPTFEGTARIEPWIQARYEIRPFALPQSRIYIGVRGSVIGEASVIPAGLNTTLKWGVKFSAKAQVQIWSKSILDYEKTFFEKEFPIWESTTIVPPTGTNSTVTDADGNVYNTIKIGTQVWMVENLKVTHYQNGDPIPNITDNTQWVHLTMGALSYYNNDNNYNSTYGKLYNWYAINDTRNIAPLGWHIPTLAEWTTLRDYLGGALVAGGKLKEAGTTHWFGPNTGATNSTGFSGLPGGHRTLDGSFIYLQEEGAWWCASPSNVSMGTPVFLISETASFELGVGNDLDKIYGLSVRCIKD